MLLFLFFFFKLRVIELEQVALGSFQVSTTGDVQNLNGDSATKPELKRRAKPDTEDIEDINPKQSLPIPSL